MIYVSTGGFKNMSPTQAIKFLNKNGINKIELSEESLKKIYLINSKNLKLIILVFTITSQYLKNHL